MPFLVTREFDRSDQKRRCCPADNQFPKYKSKGGFGCHGSKNFDRIHTQTLCSPSLIPVMLRIKSKQDWLIGLRDIQDEAWNGRRTEDGLLLREDILLAVSLLVGY